MTSSSVFAIGSNGVEGGVEIPFGAQVCALRFTRQRQRDNGDLITRATTLIIAIIAFLDGVAAPTAMPCTVTMSGCGGTFPIFVLPVDFVVDVTDAVDLATLDASDFTVNGTPADSFQLSNGDTTITFLFTSSPAGQGVNTMHIAAGAFDCGGGPVLEFTCRIRYILVRPFPTPHPRPIPPL
jgi:hypothetical protein